MKIEILAVGKKMPTWTVEAFAEYQKRMPFDLPVTLKEISTARRNKNYNKDPFMEKEASDLKKIIIANKKNFQNLHVVALDVVGKAITTPDLALSLKNWQQNFNMVNIIIGGPDGLSREILEMSSQKLSLSKLTFPHPLVRVILMEQLYRAYSINQGHPYHRE